MKGVSSDSFGLAIAYLVPGLVGMTILAQFIPEIAMWLGVRRFPGPTVGGFLYGTLGAMGTGLTLNALRWMTLDQLHHFTGIPSPTLDFSTLRHHFDAYQGIVDNHFRYYQFYGNMMLVFLALPFAPELGPSWLNGATGWGFWGVLVVVFYLASRDTLTKYYSRAAAMLSTPSPTMELDHDQRLSPSEDSGRARTDDDGNVEES